MTERVAVVGAGWTGLAAATFLRERGHHVTVLDAAPHPGGRIRTVRDAGWLVEAGPHAVMLGGEASAATEALAALAGVELVAAPPRAPRYVVHRGRPRALPTSPPALLATRLLSPAAKLRLLAEPLRGPGPKGETVAQFARRRLGRGVAPLLDAFVTGVYAGDHERLALRHAFPALAAMDAAGGILRNLPKGAPRRLCAPRGGMQAWTDALARRLRVLLATPVLSVAEDDRRVLVETPRGREAYDRVVVALEPDAAARVLGIKAAPPPRAPVAVVAFGVPADRAPRAGYGVLAPERESRFVLGALYESALFPGRAPPGHALLRCLVGGRRHPERAALPPDEMARRAWDDLVGMRVVSGEPAYVKVLPTAGIPQPEAGHDAWLDALPANGRVRALGIGHRGVGLNPLAEQAMNAAQSALDGNFHRR